MTKDNSGFISEDQIVEEINRKHAAVVVGGKFAIINEENIPGIGKFLSIVSLQSLRHMYANKCVYIRKDKKVVKVNPVDIWMKHKNRREYRGIVFAPETDTPKYYNLYCGYAIIPVEGNTQPFHTHVLQVICSGDIELFRWVMDWLAHLIQHPGGERPGTAIVMRGKQGVGKGAFIEPLKIILGQHFKHVTGQDQFTGRFNAHLKDGLLIFVDEGYWAGSKRSEGRLKALITEKLNLLEYKGKDSIFVINYMRMILASNEGWIVPAGLEERRMCVIDVSDEHRGDRRYFERYYEWVKNGGSEALLYELLHWEITSDLRTIPRTQALLDQIVRSLDSVGKFWYGILSEGAISNYGSNESYIDDTWPEYIRTKTLYAKYQSFCSDICERHPVPENQFTKRLKELAPDIRVRRRSFNGIQQKSIVLPPLYDARRTFEEIVDIDIDWDDLISELIG